MWERDWQDDFRDDVLRQEHLLEQLKNSARCQT